MSMDQEPSTRGRLSPGFALPETVGFLEQAYGQLRYGGPFDRETLAKALGHESARSGAVGVKIGALTHFGLMETAPGATYKITELGMRILHPRDDDERAGAIGVAARSPNVYADIFRDFEGKSLPNLLPHLLVRNYGVSPKTADQVAATFRSSAEFARLLVHGVLQSAPIVLPDDSADDDSRRPEKRAAFGDPATEMAKESAKPAPAAASSSTGAPAGGYSIPLKGGRVAVIHVPAAISSQDFDRIKGWLDLMRDAIVAGDEGEGANAG